MAMEAANKKAKQYLLRRVRPMGVQFSRMDKQKRILTLSYLSFIATVAITLATISYGHLFLPRVPNVPRLRLQYEEKSPYDPRKVALLIENRAMGHLASHLLHFSSVIPPDWRVRFMGSPESVSSIENIPAIKHQVAIGKMDVGHIPSNMSVAGQEAISRFLTTLWVYEQLLWPAEWLLIFQTDSMLCANSNRSLNEWLDYDWVGAPWSPDARYGGNGGLSLRRVSAIVNVLQNQVRTPDSDPEDTWLSVRLGQRRGAKVANGTLEMEFSGEMITSVHPMGYHTGGSGQMLHSGNWGTPERRQDIYEYCPEIKLMLDMDAAAFMPGTCNDNWKRGLEDRGVEESWDPMDRLVAW